MSSPETDFEVQVEVIDNDSRKSRKAYTITKQRENWTDEEHQKFLEALKLFDRDWKKIEKFIGTKSVIQIRSHAQKYFLKVQKSGTGERIPPARPKRKSAQPYPQKTKDASPVTATAWVPGGQDPSVGPFVNNPTAFTNWMATNGLLPGASVPNFSAQQAIELQRQQQEQLLQAQQYIHQSLQQGPKLAEPVYLPSSPNFAKIYTFLGSLFEPHTVEHVEAFSQLSSIEKETVQTLMHNMATNISSQPFKEQHLFLLEQYRNLIAKQERIPLPVKDFEDLTKSYFGMHAYAINKDTS